MKNLENYGVQELDAVEMKELNGGFDYIGWVSWPEGASGQNVGAGLYVAVANTGVAIANAGIAVANGVSAAWDYFTN